MSREPEEIAKEAESLKARVLCGVILGRDALAAVCELLGEMAARLGECEKRTTESATRAAGDQRKKGGR